MNEEEKVLLSAWLSGIHLEDLSLFDSRNFYESEIVEMLKEGKNLLDIGNENHRLMEMSEWTMYQSEVLYKQSLKSILEKQIHRDIAELTDLKEIRKEIEKLEGLSAETVEANENISEQLNKELERRATAKVIKWDKLPTLNNWTVGIKKKELTAIAARPAVGKSAFALQIALGAWKQGAKVLYFPLEMSTVQTFGRILISQGYASTKEIQTGRFFDEKRRKSGMDFIDSVEQSKTFRVYEAESDIDRIIACIKHEKPDVVVLDQLTQLRAKIGFQSVRQQFSYMTSTLKQVALKEDVSILLLCQINRSADNIEPTMANLKESGSIEEDSDNVILLHNLSADQVNDPSAIDWQNQRPMLLNLAKQRDGETGKFTMMFTPSRFTFYERTRENYEEREEIY